MKIQRTTEFIEAPEILRVVCQPELSDDGTRKFEEDRIKAFQEYVDLLTEVEKSNKSCESISVVALSCNSPTMFDFVVAGEGTGDERALFLTFDAEYDDEHELEVANMVAALGYTAILGYVKIRTTCATCDS